jgi:hypothetical protein
VANELDEVELRKMLLDFLLSLVVQFQLVVVEDVEPKSVHSAEHSRAHFDLQLVVEEAREVAAMISLSKIAVMENFI